MEKAREYLTVSEEESESISRQLNAIDHLTLRDIVFNCIRVDSVEPGLLVCSYKVPPFLTDREGSFAAGAISYLVDNVGLALIRVKGLPINVSVDMSISFLSPAKPDDELEISASLLGRRGGYSGILILIRNKATGELVAEGRHSLIAKPNSKL